MGFNSGFKGLIVVTKGDVTSAEKGVQAVHMLFMVTLAVELYTFVTLKLEEGVGGKLQALHVLQFLCCMLRCMICGYRALLNIMLKINIPNNSNNANKNNIRNMFPAQVLSHLPIMGTQCEILDSHGGKMGCGSRNLLTFQRKPAVSIFFHLEGGLRMI